MRVEPLSGEHVVIGSGPVGRHLVRVLTGAGASVRVITRSGIAVDGADAIACDASDVDALRASTRGAAVVYNAANPAQYHRWTQVWPPLAASILGAAEAHGAVLATAGNFYAYGPVDGLITEDHPLDATAPNGRVRRDMWLDALAAHRTGRVRVVEARGGNYVGAGVQSYFARGLAALRAGRSPRGLGNVTVPATWTYPGDMALTLAIAANTPSAHGRAWHVPSNAPRSQQELMDDVADAAGLERQRVRPLPKPLMWSLRPVVPVLRPVVSLLYQYEAPFVADDSAAREAFEIEPTPWPRMIEEFVGDKRPARVR